MARWKGCEKSDNCPIVTSRPALAAMAFPIPDYLPRNAFSRKEFSSGSRSTHWDAILSDISTLSWDALTPEQASLWTIELSNEISATRVRIDPLSACKGKGLRNPKGLISASVQQNLSSFDRQLQAAISIQSRIEDLSAVTEKLTSSLHDETVSIIFWSACGTDGSTSDWPCSFVAKNRREPCGSCPRSQGCRGTRWCHQTFACM